MRPIRLLATAAVAAALVSGCGSSSNTSGSGSPDTGNGNPAPVDNGVAALAPTEILAKAQAALPKVSSVHVTGQGQEEGQQFQLDLKIKNHEGATGSLTIPAGGPSGSGSFKIDLIVLGQTAYIKGDKTFWTAIGGGDATIANKVGGKWVKTTTQNNKVKDLLTLADLNELSSSLLKPEGTVTKGEQKKINGKKAIGLVDGSKDGGVLYIATEGDPVPVQIAEGGKGSGRVDFQDYGAPVELAAPPAGETVAEDQIGF
jgi:hypothetical protein